MQFYQTFFLNISLLISLAFLLNLVTKYVFLRFGVFRVIPERGRSAALALLFIFAGWLTMLFGLRLSENIIFDMRLLPLIMGIFVFRHPGWLTVVGIGIALSRFTFGYSDAALVGCFNVTVLGLVCMELNIRFQECRRSFRWKLGFSILVVNLLSSMNLAMFGVLPAHTYIVSIFPFTFPLGVVLSYFFAFMLHDFYMEKVRTEQLTLSHSQLLAQKNELQAAKADLEEKARQLILASRYKSDFMANMSHELKTPLNSVILLSQLLADQHEGRWTDEELEYLAIIRSSGEDLLRQINDILDLSKVEAGNLDIELEETSIAEIPHILLYQYQEEAARKGVVLETRMASNLPDLLRTDGVRVHQIMRNLVSNAVKFTNEGSVVIDIRLADEDRPATDGRWIAFSVRDTGIGIAEEKQRLIFEAFRQADSSINRKYGGMGLGLSISVELAKLLGGHLSLDSREGQGSSFTLYLPHV
ncbi:sensor histidine kinase [Paenibacillus puerhi]|uniref:sensor histidine kinase n=1 Tax=Paenibacillus puerhi TaxID=2692622 RepID=UPI00135911C1|nr:ATP-binding protein [Paenibacillus puerhi]